MEIKLFENEEIKGDNVVKKKIVIKGDRVQDVGYRLFLLDKAEEFGVSHLNAKNIDELYENKQIVEVFVGEDNDTVSNFVEFIMDIKKKGNYPRKAVVESVEIVDDAYKGNIRTTESFSRWLTNSQLYKMTEIGNTMIEKQDAIIEGQDVMIGVQRETIEEITNLSAYLREYFDKRLERLEKDVYLIKKKMSI